MKKCCWLVVFTILFTSQGFGQDERTTTPAAAAEAAAPVSTQTIRLVNSTSTVQFLQSEVGKSSTLLREVKVQIEYWSSSNSQNTDQKVNFGIVSAAEAAGAKPSLNIVPPIIKASDFDTIHKKADITVPVLIHAIASYVPEYFTIGLTDAKGKSIAAETGGMVGVNIQKESTEAEPTLPNPKHFSFINAVSFDFDGSSGSSYVGNLNVFDPKGFWYSKKNAETHRWSIGYNLGIMKINFSKSDSLNTSYSYFENALMKPLDSIKIGTKFLRQYNKITNVSKNLTWSFYFQPTLAIVYQENFKLLFHLHTELYVDKWTTNTAISNYQQDTSMLDSSNYSVLKDSLSLVNKFAKSTDDIITSTSTSAALNFNFGFGITLEKSWEGGSLFIQGTVGQAFNYARPESINKKDLTYTVPEKMNIYAHLTRFRLSQKITTNVQAVVGIDVRGKFGKNPTYAAFIGANIGLNGIRALLK